MVKVIEVLGVTLLLGLLSGCGIISEATYDTTPLVPLKTESSQAYQSEE